MKKPQLKLMSKEHINKNRIKAYDYINLDNQETMKFDTEIKNDLYERLKGLLEDKEVQEDQEIVDFYLRTLESYVLEMQGEAIYNYSNVLKELVERTGNNLRRKEDD